MKNKVLFICTHNSARSQLAEGFLRTLYGDQYEVFSAGTHPWKVHPLTIKAMQEIGIDVSKHTSKSLEKFLNQEIDFIITVCDQAKESCPVFPGGKHHFHKSFRDPGLSGDAENEMLQHFREVRDEIKHWIEKTFGNPESIQDKIKKGESNA